MQRVLVITQLRWFNPTTHPRWHGWQALPLPQEFSTFFPIDLTPDSFLTGPDDYDTPSNTIYCPCGKEIHWSSQSVGEAWRLVQAELKEHGK